MVLIKLIQSKEKSQHIHTVHRIRVLRSNSWTKSYEFSSLLFKVTSTAFALRLPFLQTYATSYSFYTALLYTVKEKRGKPSRKPYPLSYGSRNPYRNLKSENSKDCAQNPQRNCSFMYSASVRVLLLMKNWGGGGGGVRKMAHFRYCSQTVIMDFLYILIFSPLSLGKLGGKKFLFRSLQIAIVLTNRQ